ncbi:MAG: sugar ABC transporter permease [Clostridia bacterium]|nr:sugar ABC transporter permease [Clostridia bacterium]MBR6052638.1 sugar ABC transporter permease [Clostridia bacterium]
MNMVKEKIGSAPKKKKIASLDKRKARIGWLFVLPFIIGFVFIYLPIIFNSIKFSFNHIIIQTSGGYKLEFVGFQNYSDAFMVDTGFKDTLLAGLGQLVVDIPAIVLFSLFIALILNQKILGRAAFRAIFFIPVILTTGLISSIDASNNDLLNHMTNGSIDTGTEAAGAGILSVESLQGLFQNMVVGGEFVTTIVGIVNGIYDIVNRCGVQMLIFLAGLQSISPSIYESCQIDGASGWETFWKVTFPMISPIILVNVVYTIIDAFTSASNKVMAYITTVYDRPNNGNVLASAMSWTYFLIVIALIAAAAGIISSVVFYQRRD